jgi:hypothetical protein
MIHVYLLRRALRSRSLGAGSGNVIPILLSGIIMAVLLYALLFQVYALYDFHQLMGCKTKYGYDPAKVWDNCYTNDKYKHDH